MRIILFIVFSFLSVYVRSQSLADLNAQREKALADIEYVDKLLKDTENQTNEGIQSFKRINSKLRLKENVLSSLKEEINLVLYRIELNDLSIQLMQEDLDMLIEEYEKAILHAQKESKGQPDFMYIFSARDLNQGYKRLRYLQQVARYRRMEAELIIELKEEIQNTIEKQESYLKEIEVLREKEENQKVTLQKEQRSQRGLVNRLSSKQRQLRNELGDKRKMAEEIEKEIGRVIEEERKRRELSELSPDDKIVGDDFEKNMGRLPWPVERGIITSKFGVQDHPVFKGTKIDNIGIEITSGTAQKARTVFNGTVVSVFGISGGNMAVIIRHGEYLSVYQNIVNVTVKPGDRVITKQSLGDVYLDKSEGNKSILKFMVYKEKDKQNPEIWLAKKQ